MSQRDGYDVLVLGAGAAGLMCALTAGQRGKRVLVVESLPHPAAKILISGGGRCNFTNLEISPERYLSNNPHFCKSALSRYTQHDFIAMVERHRIAYHEKTLGQLFCDGSARAIVEMLMRECNDAGVVTLLGCAISEIRRSDGFRVETNRGHFRTQVVVIATGGCSIPKMGATRFAFDLARRFDLPLVEPRPGLVPLRLNGEELSLCSSLSGVSLEVETQCDRQSFREAMLFTHRGLSGPAILQISSYWRAGKEIEIDLAPELRNAIRWLKQKRQERAKALLSSVLAELWPTRLAQAIAAPWNDRTMANLSDRELAALAQRIKHWTVCPSGSEGWDKAEVTVGGIDTDALSSRTMESREVPGLYAIGEAVDVTGWLGGYNFQWAWSSGWCAGQAV
ncbi:MAG TPA: NAD(P)/FAD-dependent oxidoreductase [Candidatus Binataceae bacterium]|nr:NAD(P)/FAD-dependent oxidoreductase [Candidatus Binataceae bacterium]